MPRYAYDRFSLSLPEDWVDITEEEDESPLTFARADGVGALQFTVARYRRGEAPSADSAALAEMLAAFAEAQGLGRGFDRVQESAPLALSAASFEDGDWFIRAWFLSDGRNFAQVTYTTELTESRDELVACEAIVRSVSWAP